MIIKYAQFPKFEIYYNAGTRKFICVVYEKRCDPFDCAMDAIRQGEEMVYAKC